MRLLALIAVVLAVGTAHAGPRKLLVLRADSSTDWGTRTAVETSVLGLARNVDRGASRTDTTFAEMAGVLGCTGDVDRCKGPVLDALAIDELVVITIAPAAGGDVRVTVRRASKSGPSREASAVVAKADPGPGLTASIGPLFGATRIVEPPRAAEKPGTDKPPPVVDREDPPGLGDPKPKPSKPADPPPQASKPADPPPASKPADPLPASKPADPPSASKPADPPSTSRPTDPTPAAKRAPARTAAAQPTVTAAPDNVVADDRPRGRRDRIYVGGMVAGGVLAVAGLVLWQRAGSIEDDIHAAPNRTTADVDRLLELEASGDRYALWGNVTFIGGVAIAGVSGYLFWRSRRGGSAQARVTPVVLDRGGGIALSFGVP